MLSANFMKGICIITLLSLLGCQKSLSLDDYLAYIKNSENGLSTSIEQKPFNYTAQFVPTPLVEIRNGGKVDDGRLGESYKGMEFYQIQISSTENSEFLKVGLSDPSDYFERVAYYTSLAQSDIRLVMGNDTVYCNTYHFERSYGIRPYSTILCGFHVSENVSGSHQLLFEDRALYGDLLVFPFNASDLNNLPKIKL